MVAPVLVLGCRIPDVRGTGFDTIGNDWVAPKAGRKVGPGRSRHGHAGARQGGGTPQATGSHQTVLVCEVP